MENYYCLTSKGTFQVKRQTSDNFEAAGRYHLFSETLCVHLSDSYRCPGACRNSWPTDPGEAWWPDPAPAPGDRGPGAGRECQELSPWIRVLLHLLPDRGGGRAGHLPAPQVDPGEGVEAVPVPLVHPGALPRHLHVHPELPRPVEDIRQGRGPLQTDDWTLPKGALWKR